MRRVIAGETCRNFAISSRLEWIQTNGIGGFAMGSVAGANMRRYHGHLVAATKAPEVRTVLLAGVEAYVAWKGETYGMSTNQYVGAVHPHGFKRLAEFAVGDYTEWVFDCGGQRIVKRLKLHYRENATTVSYRHEGTEPVELTVRPLCCHKFYHDNFRVTDFYPEFLVFPEGETVLSHEGVKLHLQHEGADRTPTTGWYYRFEHPREIERGLDSLDDLFCPCELRYFLTPGEEVKLVASTEEGVAGYEFAENEDGGDGFVEMLEVAARRFLVKTEDRTSIIAGYPWFTDWGRDTMISLPGILLETGHVDEAREVLRSYASQMHQGLIPNRFVDKGEKPEYNTVDATMWFGHAIYATLDAEWDEAFAKEALGWLREVYEWHQKGTLYGIHVDQVDGLLSQGEPGVQLTWMDAKVGDWVVTPRHGKPVEVNGLWVNLLRVGEWLCEKLGEDGSEFMASAEKAEASMEEKFWHERMGHYLDTVDPDDASLRPNQLIAMSLPFAPLKGERAMKALEKVTKELLTPYGLRTLGPREPGYLGRFEGELAKRDAAYHQGTVWPWLLGPYVSALIKLTEDKKRGLAVLSHVVGALESYGIGGIAEVYDGDPPQQPGGCPWQAWSVAEVLRAWKECQ